MRPSPGPLDAHLGYWFRLLSNEVSSAFAQRLENHAVSVAQWVVLRLLFDRKDCTLAELSGVMDMDKGALSRMIDRLVKLGMVRRECGEKSRREIALSLTKKAELLVPVLAKEADQNDRSFFKVLTDRQRLSLLKTIKLLLASRAGSSQKPPLS